MMIYGKDIRDKMKLELRVAAAQGGMVMTIVQVGEEGPSTAYVNGAQRFARDIECELRIMHLPADISEEAMIGEIEALNRDPEVTGIMIQKPLPEHINSDLVVAAMDYGKDVEGVHPYNLGRLLTKEPGIRPTTPKAVIRMLKDHNLNIDGQKVTVVGRSSILGGPVAVMAIAENGTVTVCHTHTRDLAAETGAADIIIAALGKSHYITADMVKEGVVIIDAGINFDASGKITGDVHPAACAKAGYASAVPGGVGMITTAELFDNLRILAQRKKTI
ncbi:MAG: bifunctional 5,10-methylenetetrahydrofolate dehydrogenase/5,10-methenyltetrahydrofolate cyclohydrolase [Syntrophomonas sp.]|nr:bifunctional 5,10-methylenetetrahydrofolate dehydrogenase/5,10-methenyltetrahydrofolate cyclohydrolase [Syntrophomonas sp.]